MAKNEKNNLCSARRKLNFSSSESDCSDVDYSSYDSLKDPEYNLPALLSNHSSSSEKKVSKQLGGLSPFIQMWHVTF